MFKHRFKYYKSKKPPPELDKVLDLNEISALHSNKVHKIELQNLPLKTVFGLKPVHSWEVYKFTEKPGLLFIKNPFTSFGQKYWTVRCLRDYTKKPNRTNIDSLKLVPDSKHWWDMCQNNKNMFLLNKLRWVTLGYHHNWDTKVYSEDNKDDMPQDLSYLTADIASAIGFQNFIAEAAIVNYYHMDSTLSGHTDHSEQNLEAPLFSISFGQAAIFLIGGKSKEEDALSLFVRSGDIIIMSKESRLCYHGIPKILQVDSWFWTSALNECVEACTENYKDIVDICKEEEQWKPFAAYLSHSRINLNVRQVLMRGQERLNSIIIESVT